MSQHRGQTQNAGHTLSLEDSATSDERQKTGNTNDMPDLLQPSRAAKTQEWDLARHSLYQDTNKPWNRVVTPSRQLHKPAAHHQTLTEDCRSAAAKRTSPRQGCKVLLEPRPGMTNSIRKCDPAGPLLGDSFPRSLAQCVGHVQTPTPPCSQTG